MTDTVGKGSVSAVDAQAWTAAVQAGDRAAFDAIVRSHQQQIFGYLLNRHRLTPDQALDLTQQTMTVALEKLLAGGEPVSQVRAWLFAIARLLVLEQLRRDARELPDESARFAELPDPAALAEFLAADRELDRELALRRNLPTFLGLMHDAVESMPAKEREVIQIQWRLAELDQLNVDRPSPQTIDAMVDRHGMSRSEASRRIHDARRVLPEVAAALLLASTRRADCAGLDRHLTDAGWRPGRPFEKDLRQRVRQHIGSCQECRSARDRALNRIAALPVFVLFAVGELSQQRLRLAVVAFRTPLRPTPTAGIAGPIGIAGHGGPRIDLGLAAESAPAVPRPRRRRRAVGAALILLLLGGTGWTAFSRSRAPADATPASLRAAPTATGAPGRDSPAATDPTAPAPSGAATASGTPSPTHAPLETVPTAGPLGSGPHVTPDAQRNGQPAPVPDSPPLPAQGDPYPQPEITEPRSEAVDCGLRITAYITHAEGAEVVYTVSDDTNAGPGGTQVVADLTYDGEIWSAVIYPNHSNDRGRFSTTVSWHIEAFNGPVKGAPSTIVPTSSSTCYATP